MTAHTAGSTPRPWYWEPKDHILAARVGAEGHLRGVGDYALATLSELGVEPGDADANAALIVYAVNHIERTEAALAEAVRLLRHAIDSGTDRQWMLDIIAFLAAHPAPQGEVEG